jgi:uncharacterized protein (DUF1501 family)
MNRRHFLQNLGLLSGSVAFGLEGIGVQAYSHPMMFDMQGTNGKILVLVQLSGGNDGLNTIIPFEDSIYYTKRPKISIPKEQVLKLDETRGLNPALKAFETLYKDGKMNIVQNVGYENPNRSHFRSTDIWLSGSASNEYIYDGWVGRYLSQSYPNFPAQIPAHPMAVQLGSVESMLLQSSVGSMGTVFESPDSFYQLINGSKADTDPPPATLAGDELKFLKEIAAQSVQYATVIKQTADKAKNNVTYPSTNFAKQLAIVAELIMGGLETPVYMTVIGSFDTHAGQLDQQAKLFTYVAEGISAFQADLEKAGVADKVAIMTFSEFGRRVNENGSLGTDHGTAAPLFVIGKSVKPGFTGNNPSLSDLDSNGDIKYQYDFKQIYASVLQDHLGLNAVQSQQILNKSFTTLPIFKPSAPTAIEPFTDIPFLLEQNFPNPVSSLTTIRYTLNRTINIRMSLIDMHGKYISTLQEGKIIQGEHELQFEAGTLTSGSYLYMLEGEGKKQIKRMSVQH